MSQLNIDVKLWNIYIYVIYYIRYIMYLCYIIDRSWSRLGINNRVKWRHPFRITATTICKGWQTWPCLQQTQRLAMGRPLHPVAILFCVFYATTTTATRVFWCVSIRFARNASETKTITTAKLTVRCAGKYKLQKKI